MQDKIKLATILHFVKQKERFFCRLTVAFLKYLLPYVSNVVSKHSYAKLRYLFSFVDAQQ